MMSMGKSITVGILGSGQLGRMLAMEAQRLGVRTVVYSPEQDSPAGQVADAEITAAYEDLDAIKKFAKQVDVITYEFENVPLASAQTAEEIVPVYPSPLALAVSQNRIREKRFMVEHGCPVAPFHPVESLVDLREGMARLGVPAVLKTAESGYDGKGQVKLTTADLSEIEAAWEKIRGQPAVLEQWVPFTKEISLIIAQDRFGEVAYYGPIENDHQNHILDLSICPAILADEVKMRAVTVAQQIVKALDLVGLICIEFFVLPDKSILVNEIAPRPHNSGHLTIEGHVTNQFEQQLRTVCGWGVGNTAQISPAVAMANLLGDLWPDNQDGIPDWGGLLQAEPSVKLHLYGKKEARLGRKMGHLTMIDDSVGKVKKRILSARAWLEQGHKTNE